MADISFPAHLTVDRQPDVDGLPILNATFTVSEAVAALELPTGPVGERGPKGRARTTFRKMGSIANAAARPTGLGSDDRGKWWHRTDDDGMDVWDGTHWQHSPHAVGPQGPVAAANTIDVAPAVHKPNLTVPAVEFVGKGADQQLKVTAPAGLPGPKGPAGVSGAIVGSPDYDNSTSPAPGSVFAYHRASQKFRPTPPPLGTGPWSWFGTEFAVETEQDVPELTVGTFTVPAQTFAWRPLVQGHVYYGGANATEVTVRLNYSTGEVVAATRPSAGGYLYLPLLPTYREDQTVKTLSPTSTFATVPAGQPAKFVVQLTRLPNGSGKIWWSRSGASLVVHAQPL
ncbi:hypothetical protein ABZ319_12380 [Nocardia sp. NPDC005978]|uniref:hypothetical protein n=1 Tax=Nocardia sp. NPDC005978 TaxID=3156725 RepID=UPI0033A89664